MSETLSSRILYFLVRYNWQTRATEFARYNESGRGLFDALTPDVTVHRCSVELVPTILEGEPGKLFPAKHIYNETDQLDPLRITARDALRRIRSYDMFPVIPAPGISLNTRYLGDMSQPSSLKESLGVEFAGRRFTVTVEEHKE